MELLLVEDDERVRRFVRRGLEAEGYCVTAAQDGIDGLHRAQAESYDVVILDVMLPGLSGREVCRQLRQAEVPTPILMLTALDHTDDKVECLRGGADDYLTKPFDSRSCSPAWRRLHDEDEASRANRQPCWRSATYGSIVNRCGCCWTASRWS